MATSVRPAGSPDALSGWSSSRVRPASSASFIVATTSPMTLASCTSVFHFDGVDDADDRGIDRTVLQARGHARGAAAHDQDGFAEAGVDRVDGDEVIAVDLA